MGQPLLCVLALTALLLPEVASVPMNQRRKSAADATFRLVRQRCESTTCAHLPEFESDNCIHECMSPSCYQTVYAAEPLEPGEVDGKRARMFSSCFRTEAAARKKAAAVDARRGVDAEVVVTADAADATVVTTDAAEGDGGEGEEDEGEEQEQEQGDGPASATA